MTESPQRGAPRWVRRLAAAVALAPSLVWGSSWQEGEPGAETAAQAAEAGIALQESTSELGIVPREPAEMPYGPLWADLDGNGWLDLLYVNHALGELPSIYLNHGDGPLEEYFDRSGIEANSGYFQSADRHGASASDYDNDGDVDLIFARGAARGETLGIKYDQLVRNRGDGTFEKVPPEAGAANAQGRARTPTWVDIDRDGWLDLYVGNFISPNRLVHNAGGRSFVDVTEPAGLGVQGDRQAWSDYDGDGWPDVFTFNPPRLFRNRGDGTFVEMTAQSGLAEASRRQNLHGCAIAWGDFDGDGWQDVFVTSYAPGRNTLLRNDGGVFSVVAGDFGPARGETGTGVSWGDLDNDTDLDLVVLGSKTLRLFENVAGVLRAVAAPDSSLELGRESDVAFGDFDHDGRLDVALQAPAGNGLLRNVGREGSWLEIRFHGTDSNRLAFGAKVWADTGDGTIFREHWGDSGVMYSSSAAPLHLGLGMASQVGLKIAWPNGKRQSFAKLPVRRLLRLYEGGDGGRPPSAPAEPAAGCLGGSLER